MEIFTSARLKDENEWLINVHVSRRGERLPVRLSWRQTPFGAEAVPQMVELPPDVDEASFTLSAPTPARRSFNAPSSGALAAEMTIDNEPWSTLAYVILPPKSVKNRAEQEE